MKLSEDTRSEKAGKILHKLKASTGAVIIIIIVIFSLIAVAIFLNAQRGSMNTPAVILPSPIGSGNMPSEQTSDEPGMDQKAEVTAKTVQVVLSTLIRADSYSRTVSVETFWHDGSSLSVIDVWVKGHNTRILVTGEGDPKNILIQNGEIWIWYSGFSDYYHGEVKSADSIGDEYQKILSYEDVLTLESSAILDAGYVDHNGEACIFAKYISGELGYEKTIYVSVDSGLLMGAETYDGDSLVYRMVSDAPDISTPADDVFDPPGK